MLGENGAFYHIDNQFHPLDIEAKEDDAVLWANNYGIMSSRRMEELASKYKHAIIDCAQAFFCKPVEGVLIVCIVAASSWGFLMAHMWWVRVHNNLWRVSTQFRAQNRCL